MNFVTIDFETANYSRESACSAGLVKFENGKPVDTWHSLIRPPALYIRPDFTEIQELKSHALTCLGETFGITYDAHNALDDAKTCGIIACMAAEKFGSRNLKGLLKAARLGFRKI